MLNSLTTADQERLSRVAALVLCVVAAGMALWLLVRLLWLLLPQAEGTRVLAMPPPPAAAVTQSIAKWHLFGNPQSVNLAELARNAPATALRLTLRGTLALPDVSQGIAMIADEQGHEQSFNVGDDVVAHAKLVEVHPDHVVLDHEGTLEILQLPRPEAHTPDMPEANRKALGTAGPRASSVPPAGTSPFVPPQMANGALDWSKAQQALQIDPAELAKQVHIEPVFENGRIAGARLSAGGQIGTLMMQAGLKPSDMITAVNGTALAGLANPQQLMDSLKNAPSLRVTVLRDGKPATLTINLR